MATDTYLQIDGIKGESTDSQHKDWIEILSYSQAAAALASGTAAAADKNKASGPGEILITKHVDSSSPMLFKLCSSGKHIKKATLDIVRSAAGKPERIDLSDVVLSKAGSAAPNDKKAGGKTGADMPTESLSLNYGTIKWTYTQQKRTD